MWQCHNVTIWQSDNVTMWQSMQMVLWKHVKGWAPRGRPVLCLQDPSYREYWEDSCSTVCSQVSNVSNYFFCIKANSDVFIVQICMLDTLDDFIISCIFCQSGHAVLFLLHNYLHPDNGRRLLRELQKEMLHRVHSDKVKSLCQPQKIIMVTLSSVEETIEKCYHPMERLCAPPAYGEEPAEVILNLFLI